MYENVTEDKRECLQFFGWQVIRSCAFSGFFFKCVPVTFLLFLYMLFNKNNLLFCGCFLQ